MLKCAIVFFFLVVSTSAAQGAELIKVKLDDGEVSTGKLHIPVDADEIKELVIFIHGTGPNTYDNPRKFGDVEFKYYDMFGEEFNRHGIAFYTYNRRGVEIGDEPPYYDKIDREKYKRSIPSVEVKDIGVMIRALRKDKRLANAKVVLLGWSEGTMIASLVAEDKTNGVAALLLAGYAHENLFDIIKWQYSGVSSMINLRPPFDKDKDGRISKMEYESDRKVATAWREKVMQGTAFEQLDSNKDGELTAEDFRLRVEPVYKQILAKIEANDEDWIWRNYFRVSIEWLNEHFKLEPNKRRLLRLDIPIYVFHGEADANSDVEGARQLKKSFEDNMKTNLDTFLFKGHDHDLNFMEWPSKKTIPEGIEKIFEVAKELNN